MFKSLPAMLYTATILLVWQSSNYGLVLLLKTQRCNLESVLYKAETCLTFAQGQRGSTSARLQGKHRVYQLMKDPLQLGKSAYFKHDQLVENVKYYIYDIAKKKPIKLPNQGLGQCPTQSCTIRFCSLNIRGLKNMPWTHCLNHFVSSFPLLLYMRHGRHSPGSSVSSQPAT